MPGNYKMIDIKDGPITTISEGMYILYISRASYLDIRNPENPIKVIGSLCIPQDYYDKIIEDLAKYNKEIYNSYKLDGTIVSISYRGPEYSQLERTINREKIEILSDDNLKDKIEIITNNVGLYQLINNKGDVKIAVKISIF